MIFQNIHSVGLYRVHEYRWALRLVAEPYAPFINFLSQLGHLTRIYRDTLISLITWSSFHLFDLCIYVSKNVLRQLNFYHGPYLSTLYDV